MFIPLAGLLIKSLELPLDQLWEVISNRRALASYRLTFGASFIAASLNLVFGLIVAWCWCVISFLVNVLWMP